MMDILSNNSIVFYCKISNFQIELSLALKISLPISPAKYLLILKSKRILATEMKFSSCDVRITKEISKQKYTM